MLKKIKTKIIGILTSLKMLFISYIALLVYRVLWLFNVPVQKLLLLNLFIKCFN